jgi:DNA replication and repair protein RecF
MKVETLYVCHFRNLKPQQISPDRTVNELVGDNAQGKTAILEALHVLVLGSSFRTYQLRELVQHGERGFFIEGVINSEGVHKTVSVTYDGNRRSVTIDGQVQESSCMLLGNLLGVTATLEDHELIFGAPAIRRRFLDEQIAQIDPFYVVQLSRYTRALSARNRLLKARDCRTIGAWEEQLAKAGAYIVHQRRQTVSLLSPRVICAYQSLFPEKNDASPFSMRYITQCPQSEDAVAWYQGQFAARREQEMKAASTLVGPHRDDMEWSIGDRPCKTVASLGQARSVAVALRCAEWGLLSERSRQTPLFLIDDVESTLDANRKNIVLELCQQFGQVFLTCHKPQSTESHVLNILNGAVV